MNVLRFSLVPALLCVSASAFGQFSGASWIAPTAEELSMTSIPEVPGASAVVLYKEETGDDTIHMQSYYYRVKVLSEGGKEQANVELPYVSGESGYTIDSISGRTIHPDGSITPFTGKPYDKLIERSGGRKMQAKVFSLPNVDVGSILEYRYKLRYDDTVVNSPDWYVQTDLFTRKAHYLWKPSPHDIRTEYESNVNSVAWTPILPEGAVVKEVTKGGQRYVELETNNIKPMMFEPMMPPMNSLSYRVMFYYTGYKTTGEFWREAGKHWSDARNKFIGPGSAVKSATADLLRPSDTEEQKLRKIYDFVETLDNTAFSREHSASEDRAQGFKEVSSTDDVLKRKRGNDDQLTELFVAMVRAAGMKAYVMGVANRERRLFVPNYLSTRQLDDYVAVVPVDGKDMYFDPGQRYCEFGHLSWKHGMTAGLRQSEKGTEIASTPGGTYKDAKISRIADLALSDRGEATGSVTLTFAGDPALVWRQEALKGDDTSLNKDLKTELENMLPAGMEIRVTKVDGLADSSKPLVVTYEVKGPVGAATGKRLLVPANLFQANAKTTFTATKREQAVDLHYGRLTQDAVRFKIPSSMVIESVPADAKEQLVGKANYVSNSKTAPSYVTLYRNLVLGQIYFAPDQYGDLRSFYSKVEAKDQEPLVLTRASALNTGGAAPPSVQ